MEINKPKREDMREWERGQRWQESVVRSSHGGCHGQSPPSPAMRVISCPGLSQDKWVIVISNIIQISAKCKGKRWKILHKGGTGLLWLQSVGRLAGQEAGAKTTVERLFQSFR